MTVFAAIFMGMSISPTHAASFPAEFDPATIDETQGRRLNVPMIGTSANDFVVDLGDVDGDGYADAYVFGVALNASGHYLLWGAASSDPVTLDPLSVYPSDGVLVQGVSSYSWGREVGAAGDINADGLADWWARLENGAMVLVYGREGRYPSPFDINSFGSGEGIRFLPDSYGDDLNFRDIHPAGDLDGDGIDDIVLNTFSLSSANPLPEFRVLYGSQSTLADSIDANDLPATDVADIPISSTGIATGGDLNGDGLADLAIAGPPLVVVYGSVNGLPATINPSDIESDQGYVVQGSSNPFSDYRDGQLLDIASDVNGDGIDDLFIGSEVADEPGAYVVYGQSDDWGEAVELNSLSPDAGYAIRLGSDDDASVVYRFNSGSTVGMGDINDDGIDDMSIGNAIVYGMQGNRSTILLSQLDGNDGFLVTGTPNSRIWPVQDVNNDAIDDWMFRNSDTGYLVFGRDSSDAPASVRSLTAAFGKNLIELRWIASASDSVVNYEIQRNGQVLAIVDASVTRYEDTSAAYGVAYTYVIIALDGAGRRSASAVLDVQNNESLYPQISGQVYSNTLAEVFWSYDNVEYRIYRDGLLADTRYASSYLDADYDPSGHTYFVEVVPPLGSQTTVRSPSLHLPDQAGTALPARPTQLEFELYSTTTLELFWSRVTTATLPVHYEIMRDGVLLGLVDGISFMDKSVPSFVTQNAPFPPVVEYRVTTIDGGGRRSNPRKLVIDIKQAIAARNPAVAVDLLANFTSDTTVELAWERSSTGTVPAGYEVVLDASWFSDETHSGRVIATTEGTGIVLDDLTPNRRYFMSVVAYDENGNRSVPNTIRFVTPFQPQVPGELRAAVYGQSIVELFWDRDHSGYAQVRNWEVYRDGQLVAEVEGNSWIDDSLEFAKDYQYYVISVFGDRKSGPSSTITVNTATR